jgi:alkylresorcinol/alkylpyrone synthase
MKWISGDLPPTNPAQPNGGSKIAIAATATALPPHAITREEVKQYLGEVFSIEASRAEAMMAVIDNSQVKRRYCVHPVEWIIEPRPLSRISEEYREQSIRLGGEVAANCLAKAGMTPNEIDMIVTVSCTGVMIPSLDAYLVNDLGFQDNVKRLPITELGCAAGAAGLARANDFVRAYPGTSVLVVAVEIPSLTFQRDNLTQANLISTVLFGDGAAAAVVTGRAISGPHILDVDSYLFPRSIDAMGFDLKETGFHIVLSKDVPQLIRERVGELFCSLLKRNNVRAEEISAFIMHPGGQKLLQFIEEELGLQREKTEFSWHVLREYGNLSSASVLFVLHEWMTRRSMASGDYGLMAAFGPGFSAEMLLLQWK